MLEELEKQRTMIGKDIKELVKKNEINEPMSKEEAI